ncbi:ECM4 (YKR076W) [Zygosaccharomyces parabailii]|uniref:BN860_01178g1_1 n=1 Tax=Zygosaccharomyces bailii (strain CLIB 213 / ATCC 58445 / CBS 680 / BCRC 21525 / NBRC 1098 / NCYC 1416 / NRRL Y-2227) TaxID=1333698 RepID=A0A8J2SZJ4_ZYGB2|nr:ECM4 (YKR076W) [Zygosaccharomyces parabailii]CDF87206.1 BN860_01178g1_1 [Zygosaccharomyces bailii CLIB 213]SJM88210.1 probable Glutathione S-transferase omega-like 2 [Zygosaccharomyces bailii]
MLGKWSSADGSFKRQRSVFQEPISSDHPVFKPAKGRYWLYVSLACPWAHRTLITRALKGLTSVIGVSVVHWHLDAQGWRFLTADEQTRQKAFKDGIFESQAGGIASAKLDKSSHLANVANDSARLFSDATFDPNQHAARLSELYYKADPDYNARFTVPVLWDTQTQTIVSNESAQIIRTLNSGVLDEFAGEEATKIDLVPSELESQIDEFNAWVYDNINNGVYKTGFAESAAVYENEVTNVFAHLNRVESILSEKYGKLKQKYHRLDEVLAHYYTVGEQLTEADVRLYTTIIRFDPVYVQHFKCNFTTIRDGYPHIHLWMQNLYWNNAAFRLTTDFDHIKLHYTRSHTRINPLGITPLGPIPDIKPLVD